MRSASVATIWLPWHEVSLDCWCRPRISDGGVVLHRQVILRPDVRERASVFRGGGVPA